MPECPFCGIAAGDLDAHVVHEDEDVIAFLDAEPVSEGHTLVVPKTHAEELPDLDPDTTAAVFRVVRAVAAAQAEGLDAAGVNVVQNNGPGAGQEVPHMHVHVIPRADGDGLEISFDGEGLDGAEAEQVADRIRDALA